MGFKESKLDKLFGATVLQEFKPLKAFLIHWFHGTSLQSEPLKQKKYCWVKMLLYKSATQQCMAADV